MRSAIGNSLLLSLVLIIVSAVMILFVSVISYSKAYRVKNRIIEIIERYGSFEYEKNGKQLAKDEITEYLFQVGYQLGECPKSGFSGQDTRHYKYCVWREDLENGEYYYQVTAYVEFNFPIVGSISPIPVTGETKILGTDYSSKK